MFSFRSLFTIDSPNRKIFRAALAVALFGAVAKLAAAGKELAIARVFGRGDVMDAYLIAYLAPSFLVTLLMGALGACLVPVLVNVRQKEGAAAAQKLFSCMLALCIAALIIVAVLLGVAAPAFLPYLGSAFSPEKLYLTRLLLYLLLPFVLFNGIAQFAVSVLNAGEKFALPAFVPVVTPIVTVLFILLARSWGVYALAIGTVGGSILEALWLMRLLQAHGIRPILQWDGLDPTMRHVLSQFFPMLAGTFLMGGTAVVDQSMAAMLSSGSVAALSYANKVVGLVLAVGATALSTASLPYFSQMAAEHDWKGCLHTLKKYSFLVAAITIPLTLGLIFFSRTVVTLLFQRGAFNSSYTALVSRVQTFYAIQIPFYICGMLFVRFLSAIRRNDLLMYGSAMNLVLDIVLNLILIRFLGVAGIALSTSFVLMASFLFVTTNALRILRQSKRLAVEERVETAVP